MPGRAVGVDVDETRGNDLSLGIVGRRNLWKALVLSIDRMDSSIDNFDGGTDSFEPGADQVGILNETTRLHPIPFCFI